MLVQGGMPATLLIRSLRSLPLLALLACSGGSGPGQDPMGETPDAASEDSLPVLTMITSLGSVEIEVLTDTAPLTATNFLVYIDEGFYDGSDGKGATHFHRVISDFMVQGGGFTVAGAEKATHAPITNEAATSGLSNVRGTVAMARTTEPNSATAQFYINVVDNTFLDAAGQDPGYAVFARVTSGMDVVDQIAGVSTDGNDQPTSAVAIESFTRNP